MVAQGALLLIAISLTLREPKGGRRVFLDLLRRRNPAFLDAVIALHQQGAIPANAYALDLDAVQANARALRDAADRHGLTALAMTKQVGRAPGFLDAVRAGGIDAAVAVDMACARRVHAGGLRVGHVGHLVQVPSAEAGAAAALDPVHWTVFSDDKAAEAAAAARAAGREQALLARIEGARRPLLPGPRGRLRRRRRRRGRPPARRARRRPLRRRHLVPGAPLRPRRARGAPDAEPGHARARRRAAARRRASATSRSTRRARRRAPCSSCSRGTARRTSSRGTG